jgi:hypothetical protein
MPAPRAATDVPLSSAEWDLLARLPRHVLVAATSTSHGSPLAGGLAGAEVISAARADESTVVRRAVARLYAQPGTSDDELPITAELADPAARPANVLGEAAVAGRILRDRLPRVDAEAYRRWLVAIAAAAAAHSSFPDRLRQALRQ